MLMHRRITRITSTGKAAKFRLELKIDHRLTFGRAKLCADKLGRGS